MVAAIPFLPQSFTERMGTITNYQGDESASTRVQVWKWTLDYVKENPFGGGFDAYLGNSFTYETRKVVGEGNNQTIEYNEVTDKARAYHSSLLRDARRAGLARAWSCGCWLHGARRVADGADPLALRASARTASKTWQWGLATALQQSQIVYLVGALFVGIAYQPFIFMLVGLQCALWSYVQRTETVPHKARFRRPREALPA